MVMTAIMQLSLRIRQWGVTLGIAIRFTRSPPNN
jgi:hypothetical protein